MADRRRRITELKSQCLCKAHQFSAQVSVFDLPLVTSACHCDSCRHLTGALYTLDPPWPEPRGDVDVSKLSVYQFTPNYDVLFCGTCSTPMFFANRNNPDEQLGAFSGTIENHDVGVYSVIKVSHHIFVGDTLDGGAAAWMKKPNGVGTEATRHKERVKEKGVSEYPADWPHLDGVRSYGSKKKDDIPIRCKCEGVNLVWRQQDYEGLKKEDLPWYIDPATLKSLAIFCACDSCRFSGGTDMWPWTFSDLSQISFPSSASASFPKTKDDLKALVDAKDPSIGTLTYYSSSPGVQRYFCSTCSACVLYATDERPKVVDIAVGILRDPDGARAEGVLSWEFGNIDRMDDVPFGWRRSLLENMEKECEQWRFSRGYPKTWRRVSGE